LTDKEKPVTPAERTAETAVLHQNAVDYWHCVDHAGGAGVSAMFVEQGVFHAGPGDPLVGREAIEGFFAWRQGRGERTSRHVIANFHAEFAGPGKARTWCVMLLYASDGAPPHTGTNPALVADMIDDCVKGPDGVWRYAERTFVPLWMSGAELTSAPESLKDKPSRPALKHPSP
jgi:hypothetical protein